MKLSGKVALLTGGSSGIGLETAKLLKKEGARIIITGRDEKILDEASSILGGDVFTLKADVADLEQIDNLYAKISEKFGKIDILFANAGIGRFVPLEDTTERLYDEIFNINLKGLFFTIQKSLIHLNNNSSIVLNASFLEDLGIPGTSILSASKAAVRSLARTFSSELIGRGIRVNVVSPGAIETLFLSKSGLPQESIESMANNLVGQIPMKRFGLPEEVAKAVLFLCSSDSSYILGADIPVDGGISQL